MVYCINCGKKVSQGAKFCQGCGLKLQGEYRETKRQNKEPENVQRVIEKHVVQRNSSGSGIGTALAILLVIIVVIVIIFFVVIALQGGNDISRGSGIPYVDPCERQFNQCNKECGEGILSGLCKEKCSYEYRDCRS